MTKKSISFVLLALATAAVASCSGARRNWHHLGDERGSFGVELVVAGAPLPVFEHRGRSYAAGQTGQRYTVRVHNWSDRRVEAVVAVDGLDVIDGREADPDKRGYIIGPYSYADIDGWRTSLHEVAAFRFTRPDDSYAVRTGHPGELGLVEVCLFSEEQQAYRPERPPLVTGSDRGRPGMESKSRAAFGEREEADGLGTAFGERRASAVSETGFERDGSGPVARLALRYDNPAGLCRAGLERFCPARGPLLPVPRPRDPETEFAKPPPGWEGSHRF